MHVAAKEGNCHRPAVLGSLGKRLDTLCGEDEIQDGGQKLRRSHDSQLTDGVNAQLTFVLGCGTSASGLILSTAPTAKRQKC